MFLDDQIVKIVIDGDTSTKESSITVLQTIIKLCGDKIANDINGIKDENLIKPITQRVCKSWDSAAIKLNKKGIEFLRIGGLKHYLLSKPDLAEILNKVNFQ